MPEKLQQRDVFSVFHVLIFAEICTHLFLITFCIVAATPRVFIFQNIFGIAAYLVLLVLVRFKCLNQEQGVMFTAVSVWVQVLVSFYFVGITGGFQNYCFATLSTSFFLTYTTGGHRATVYSVLVEVGSALIFLLLCIWGTSYAPVYPVDERSMRITNLVNSLVSLGVVTLFARFYRQSIMNNMKSLRAAAELDELTKLFNRRGIRKYLEAFQQEWDEKHLLYAVTILDLDDFKQVNDTYGHNEGDRVLMKIGEILSSYADAHTYCCRWGGEEFLVIFQLPYGRFHCYEVLNRILNDIRAMQIKTSNGVITMTVTMGCAFSEPDVLIHELLHKADSSLYLGKSSGKNQVVYAD